MYFKKSSLNKRIQELKDSIDLENKVEEIVPYPEPTKSKVPYKQQLLPFDIDLEDNKIIFDLKDNKIWNSSIFPKTNKEKLENLLKQYSASYWVRIKYFLTKAWILIKESFIIIFHNILEILSTIIVFIYYTIRGLIYLTIEVLILLACALLVLLTIALLAIPFIIMFDIAYL
ncbi:uncharacterized protein KGF55_001502 [Candida pseudojiufengensis]|uniref:uncharacterized protein n=1 Tax=Candida pseudojiufengensis TaxID=497109 RepID=UPI002225106C|nr:uncharacterized protein KGF55_001502 [Candida pseudojiufengensis]KAI5965282.1 hypothetical protein KGF55_001502 [Candida pseudojiufengensis]